MIETITLDTRKDYTGGGNAHISPLRRGERNNFQLTVVVLSDRKPYDLTGMTAHLVWKAADGKLVGPVPMEVTDATEGIVSCILPEACYSAVGTARAYIELRGGEELVDTTDDMLIKVLDCIDADGEQAEEYKTLIAEVRDATDAAVNAAMVAAEKADTAAGTIDAKIATETNRATAAESALCDSVSYAAGVNLLPRRTVSDTSYGGITVNKGGDLYKIVSGGTTAFVGGFWDEPGVTIPRYGEYTLSADCRFSLRKNGKNIFISKQAGETYTATFAKGDVLSWSLYVYEGETYTTGTEYHFQLERGTTAHAYQPYTADLQQRVAGLESALEAIRRRLT